MALRSDWSDSPGTRRRLTLRSSLQISYLPLAAASCRGVNFHKSATFTEAPCLTSSSATS